MTGRLEEVLSTTTAVSPTDGALETMREKMRAGRERTTSACSSSGPELGTSPTTDSGGTPTRRNKRKMTAPKRRSDFSIKRFCPELMSGDEHRAEHGDDLEDYDDLGRERVPDRPAASTGSSPDSRRDSRPSSTATSPGDADLRPPSSPLSTPDLHHRRRASSRLSSHDEELIPSPVSPHPSRGEVGRHRHDDPQLVHPMGLHHPAFGLSRHLALGTLPVHLTPVPMATPAGLLPGHHPPHLQGVPGGTQGLLPMAHLQVAYPGGGPSSPVEFHTPGPPSPTDSTSSMADGSSCSGGKKARKNYKNMTRERRVEANARERSRVHTISAAFDSLRRAVPSYSYNQKLSKLAILRIACSYILSLAKLADLDLSTEHSDYTFADCVDMCTSVIQTEGRARRRH